MKKRFIKGMAIIPMIAMSLQLMAPMTVHASENVGTSIKSQITVPEVQTGWQGSIASGNRSYVDENGICLTGLQVIEEETYFFNEDGILQTGWQIVEGENLYFSLETGARCENGKEPSEGEEVDEIEKSVSVQEASVAEDDQENSKETQILIGWHWNNGWFYYDNNGNKKYGWQKISGKWYYLDGKDVERPGVMLANCSRIINGRTYFFEGGGVMQTGWIKRPEGWYYADINGAMQTGWIKLGGKWYYLDKNNVDYPGLMVANKTIQLGKYIYTLKPDGVMATGWYFVKSEGYHFYNQNGNMQKGWIKTGGKWYYLDPDNSNIMVANCKKTITGYEYLFKADGSLVTGWYYIKGEGYRYYNQNGHQEIGWIKVAGKWYYMNPSNDGIMVAAKWLWLNNHYYYLKADGAMATNWLNLDGNKFFMSSDGVMRTGWQYINGNWYYFYTQNSSQVWGAMARNTTINGWEIGADGVMLTGGKAEMSMKAQLYSSNTNYLILVDRAACKVAVFSGQVGFWSLIKYWDCSPGKSSTPTVSGTFTVGSRGYSFGSGYTCYYWTQFYGNYLFHSVLYNQGTFNIQDGRLGIPLSHGCVRMQIDNAKWIYDNIPSGTKVVVY